MTENKNSSIFKVKKKCRLYYATGRKCVCSHECHPLLRVLTIIAIEHSFHYSLESINKVFTVSLFLALWYTIQNIHTTGFYHISPTKYFCFNLAGQKRYDTSVAFSSLCMRGVSICYERYPHSSYYYFTLALRG